MEVSFVAYVPESHQKNGVAWLILEEGHPSGAFLYMCDSPAEITVFDYWFRTIEEAKSVAAQEWGVTEDQWEPRSAR